VATVLVDEAPPSGSEPPLPEVLLPALPPEPLVPGPPLDVLAVLAALP